METNSMKVKLNDALNKLTKLHADGVLTNEELAILKEGIASRIRGNEPDAIEEIERGVADWLYVIFFYTALPVLIVIVAMLWLSRSSTIQSIGDVITSYSIVWLGSWDIWVVRGWIALLGILSCSIILWSHLAYLKRRKLYE